MQKPATVVYIKFWKLVNKWVVITDHKRPKWKKENESFGNNLERMFYLESSIQIKLYIDGEYCQLAVVSLGANEHLCHDSRNIYFSVPGLFLSLTQTL